MYASQLKSTDFIYFIKDYIHIYISYIYISHSENLALRTAQSLLLDKKDLGQ